MSAVEVGAVGRGRGRPSRPDSPCRAALTRCCRSGLDRGWCGERGGKDDTGDGFCVCALVPRCPRPVLPVQSFNDGGSQWVWRAADGAASAAASTAAGVVQCLLRCLSELMRRHRRAGGQAGLAGQNCEGWAKGNCSVVMDMECRLLCTYVCVCMRVCMCACVQCVGAPCGYV